MANLSRSFVNEIGQKIISKCKVWEKETLGGSDHRPIILDIDAHRRKHIEDTHPRPFKRWKLKEKEYIELYNEILEATIY
jgi:hypothetical protein